jgi:hypothetical protein
MCLGCALGTVTSAKVPVELIEGALQVDGQDEGDTSEVKENWCMHE